MTHWERKAARRAYRHASRSSYGSSGGSHSAFYGSYGGSSSSGGSSSGSYGYYGYSYGYAAPAASVGYSSMSPMTSSMPVDAYRVITDEPVGDVAGDSGEEVQTPAPSDSTEFVPKDGVLLLVSVPNKAKVLVNGSETTSTGSLRRFVSRGLQEGATYDYTVTMVVNDGEKPVEETQVISVTAGELSRISFEESLQLTTSLTVHVPEKSTVWLAGNMTDSTGTTRTFETSALPTGSAWENYEIRVVTKHAGKEHTISKVIDLAAGDDVELSFETSDTLADASLIEKTASIQ